MLSGRLIRLQIAALALVALLGAGCGDDEEPAAPQRPAETVDQLPDLPPGWTAHVNHGAGFVIGVPPGWSAKDDGIRSLLRSPDRLVAATVTADRTDDALASPLTELASSTVSRLPGVEDLEPGHPHRFDAPYDAVAVDATGIAGAKGVKQRFLLVVMRRDRLVNLTVLVARNAEQDTSFHSEAINRMLRSLRSRPVGATYAGRSG
jgi:hypothetical protein